MPIRRATQRCPFQLGKYHLTIDEWSGQTGQCKDNKDSVADVGTQTVTFNSCLNSAAGW